MLLKKEKQHQKLPDPQNELVPIGVAKKELSKEAWEKSFCALKPAASLW